MTTQAFRTEMERVLAHHGVEAESTLVDVPALAVRSHVLVSGDGPPLVMLNGGGTPAAMLAPIMAKIDGHRIYAVDLPGFGLTDVPPGWDEDLRDTAVAFVRGTLDALGLGRVYMLGNSFGSLVTFWLALDDPKRVAAAVHVGCPALILGTSAPLPMRLMSTRLGPLLMRLDPPSPGQVRRLSKMVGEHPLPPEIADLLLATERLDGFGDSLLAMFRQLVRLRGARTSMSLGAAELARIDHRVRLIWGKNDPFGPIEVGRAAAAALPHAEFSVVPGGHAPWLRSAEEVGALINRFLANVRLGRAAGADRSGPGSDQPNASR